MRALVVYDSVYGNTEQIAKAIGSALGPDAKVARPGEVTPEELKTIELLVVGSPTQGGRPLPTIQDLLKRLPDTVKSTKVAAFDTRYSGRFVKVFGFAAERVASDLQAKGATLLVPPEPFFVGGKKGPLREGELDRAAGWARKLLDGMAPGA